MYHQNYGSNPSDSKGQMMTHWGSAVGLFIQLPPLRLSVLLPTQQALLLTLSGGNMYKVQAVILCMTTVQLAEIVKQVCT